MRMHESGPGVEMNALGEIYQHISHSPNPWMLELDHHH